MADAKVANPQIQIRLMARIKNISPTFLSFVFTPPFHHLGAIQRLQLKRFRGWICSDSGLKISEKKITALALVQCFNF